MALGCEVCWSIAHTFRAVKFLLDVNEAAQWTTLITALTLPTPPAPVITHTGRLNATIQWDSPYSPSSQDETRFGFVINVCEALNRSRCSTAELEKSDLKRSMKRLELEQPIYSTVISKALAPSTAYVSR